MDRILIAASRNDLPRFRAYAEKYDLGLELQSFSEPATLSNNWLRTLDWHKELLAGFAGDIGVHGAFYDMTSASMDPAILAITQARYRQNLHVAAELNARYVLFHLNYLGACRINNYRSGWHQRQVRFWSKFAVEAAEIGIPVLLENSWEDDPTLISNILAEVDNPYLKACLDIAHATLYSEFPVDHWIQTLEPYLFCSHLNNHDGKYDMHWSLDRGVVEYGQVLRSLRKMTAPPYFCLEMPDWPSIANSLPQLELSPESSVM